MYMREACDTCELLCSSIDQEITWVCMHEALSEITPQYGLPSRYTHVAIGIVWRCTVET